MGNDVRYITLESRDILIFFLVFITLKSMSRLCFNKYRVIKCIVNFFVILSVFKCLITIYCTLKGIPVSTIVDNIQKITGWGLQTYDVGDSNLSRIQFPIDLVSCFVIYFQWVMLREDKRLKNIVFLILLYLSILLTMSRIFWFITIVVTIGYFIFVNKVRFNLKYLSLALVLSVSLGVTFSGAVSEIVSTRLSSQNNYYSDLERQIQNIKIEDKINNKPLLGYGIGYYIPDYLRSYVDGYKYAYESQVLATIMKIGFIGFFIFILVVLITAFNDLRMLNSSTIFMRGIFFSLWIVSGYYNPLLFNVPAGMIMFLCSEINIMNNGNISKKSGKGGS